MKHSKIAAFNINPTKAQQWAIGGGLGGATLGGASTLLYNLIDKDRRKNITKNLFRNMLIGAGVGAGAGYGTNKALGRYIANSLIENNAVRAYDKTKIDSIKPKGFDELFSGKPKTWKEKKKLIKSIVKDVYRKVKKPVTLEMMRNTDKPYSKFKFDELARAELMARNLGVFDESKGSYFTKLTDKEKERYRNLDKVLFPKVEKRHDTIYTPKIIGTGFVDPAPQAYYYTWKDILKENKNKNHINASTYHDVMANFTGVIPKQDSGMYHFYDVWDYALHKPEEKELRDSIAKLRKGAKNKSMVEKLKYYYDSIINPNADRSKESLRKNILVLGARKLFTNLFENPIAVYGSNPLSHDILKTINEAAKPQ